MWTRYGAALDSVLVSMLLMSGMEAQVILETCAQWYVNYAAIVHSRSTLLAKWNGQDYVDANVMWKHMQWQPCTCIPYMYNVCPYTWVT